MLLSLALASALSAVPNSWILEAPRAARLAVPDEAVADSPVEGLTLAQLHAERHRLAAEMPGLVGPIVLLSGGGLVTLGFGTLTGLLFYEASRPGNGVGALFAIFLGFATGVVTVVGLAAAIIGTVLLIRASSRRDTYTTREGAIAARISAIEKGEVAEPLPPSGIPTSAAQLDRERQLRALQDSRPGLALPIGLAAGGLTGAAYLLGQIPGSSSTRYTTANIVFYVVLGVISAAALTVGTLLLVRNLRERARIGQEIDGFAHPKPTAAPAAPSEQPPPPPLLNPEEAVPDEPTAPPPPPSSWSAPPAPIFFSWAVAF